MIELIEKKRRTLVQLCQKFHVCRLDVFGSAAVGDFDEASSDLDFLVEFDEGVADRRFDNYFDLLRALQHLFGKPVDLVEPGGMENPYFIQHVNKTRKQLYVAP